MLATDGLSCRADGLPAYVTATSEVIASIACAGSGPVYNDQPESALTVGPELPRQYQQDVRYATVVDEPPSTCGPYTRSVWYRVPAEIAAEGVVVDTLEAKFNSLVTVYRDDSGALTQVACNDNVNPPVIQQSRLAFKGDGVSDYVVKVAAFSITRAAVIRVNFSALDSPGNDDTSGAVPLAIDGPKHLQPAHNSVASATDPDLSCAGNYGFTTWYSVTPDVSGPLTVRTSGSTFDTVMGAFDGAVQVGCNDQEAVNLDTSKVTWNAEAGTTYTVVVGSFLGRAAGVLHIAAESGP
jgi:hypothetical protein